MENPGIILEGVGMHYQDIKRSCEWATTTGKNGISLKMSQTSCQSLRK